VSEQMKKVKGQEQGKKPIAIAVTLILLVISLIFVILFASKNIAYKQELQVNTGEDIVEDFKQLDRKLDYLESNINLLIDKGGNWDEAAALTSSYSRVLLQDVSEHIEALYAIGNSIESKKFGPESKMQLEMWHVAQDELMMNLEESGKQMHKDHYSGLQLLQGQIDQMQAAVGRFNFKMEGVKNAMIRLSAGFDWIEYVEEISEVAIVEDAQ